MTLPTKEDIESHSDFSGLLGPSLVVHNSKGEVIFSMKRKDKYPPMYYIFEKHEDKMSEEEKEKFKQAWAMISGLAGLMGLPLYDMREISDGMEAQVETIKKTDEYKEAMKKADSGELVFVKDISFKLFDHATGNINTLTVGVNLKDVSVDNGPEATEESV